MPKVGRNEPCPCGSGKKYKKCCMEKDEQQEREARAALREEPDEGLRPELEEDLYVGDLFEDEDEEYETEEEVGLWRRFREADYEGQIALFLEALEADKLDDNTSFDMLSDIWLEAKARGDQGRFEELIARLRQDLPEAYEEDWPYYIDWLLRAALARGETNRIPSLLEPFSREPERDIEQFLWIADLLMYHDQARPLLTAMVKAWPAVGSSADIAPEIRELFANAIIQLTLFDHLDRGGSPEITDPELQKALSLFRIENVEWLSEALASLSGRSDRSWTVADFEYRGGRNRAAVERDTYVFDQQWLGNLRWRHGVPFSHGELARLALAHYHSQQIANGKSGLAVLVPRSTTLADLVEQLFDVEGTETFKAASLMQLLPLYLRFLGELGLLGEAEEDKVLKSLRKVADRTAALLREDGDRDLAEDVEQAWL